MMIDTQENNSQVKVTLKQENQERHGYDGHPVRMDKK